MLLHDDGLERGIYIMYILCAAFDVFVVVALVLSCRRGVCADSIHIYASVGGIYAMTECLTVGFGVPNAPINNYVLHY